MSGRNEMVFPCGKKLRMEKYFPRTSQQVSSCILLFGEDNMLLPKSTAANKSDSFIGLDESSWKKMIVGANESTFIAPFSWKNPSSSFSGFYLIRKERHECWEAKHNIYQIYISFIRFFIIVSFSFCSSSHIVTWPFDTSSHKNDGLNVMTLVLNFLTVPIMSKALPLALWRNESLFVFICFVVASLSIITTQEGLLRPSM